MRSTPLRAVLAALAVLAAGAAARAQVPVVDPSRISLDEFKKAFDEAKLLVIDVRSADSYRAGHIRGAISVPLSALDTHLPQLKAQKKPIVAYCA
jgi:predicted sulfurtransferase